MSTRPPECQSGGRVRYANDSTEVDSTIERDFVYANFPIDQYSSQKITLRWLLGLSITFYTGYVVMFIFGGIVL